MSTTKYSAKSRTLTYVGIFLCLLPFILLTILAACTPTTPVVVTTTPAPREISLRLNVNNPVQDSTAISGRYTGGSECHGYTSEVAPILPVYDYCQNAQRPVMVTPLALFTELVKKIHDTVTPTVSPSVTSTTISVTVSPTITGTPSPEITPTETVTEEPTATPTKEPTATVTENPTDVPTATSTPKVTETPSPEPTKECKNKNDDKKPGENPTDCNAGIGNG